VRQTSPRPRRVETVSRQLTKLRQLGTIGITNNRTIEVDDLASLRVRCG